jgi:mono/diheme cytochrome c family protein
MRISAAPSNGRKPNSLVLRGLPLAAAVLMLTPVFALGQGSSTPETPAAETPAASDSAAAVAPGTVASYTKEQAARGKQAYTKSCSTCHGTTLGGSGEAPAVAGAGFRENWFVGSPQPFMDYISHNMPQDDPGSLEPETYADIAAYLMSVNHVPAGDTELPSDEASLTNITLPPLN